MMEAAAGNEGRRQLLQKSVLLRVRESLLLAGLARRAWTPRQYIFAAGAAFVFGLLLGLATVLIPNTLFSREIATLWWNYPVWAVTSIGVGLLFATYVRPSNTAPPVPEQPRDRRSSRLGVAGGFLAWFAVGCPVCNKIALFALGYSGAITWFAPLQPMLAVAGLVFTYVALVSRLRGQISCSLSAAGRKAFAAQSVQ